MRLNTADVKSATQWILSKAVINGIADITIDPAVSKGHVAMKAVKVNWGGRVIIKCGGNLDANHLAAPSSIPVLDFSGWVINKGADVRIDRRLFEVWSAQWGPREIAPSAQVTIDMSLPPSSDSE
jgi:hypothetical protein